jgi:NitT/TauT family transport system substrate-binding protein
MSMRRALIAIALGAASLALAAAPAAEAQTTFTIARSASPAWMFWTYASETGILGKWAAKYGVAIRLRQAGTVGESLDLYASGAVDGVLADNIDLLAVSASRGIDSTAIILDGYSNGSDAVILKSAGIAPKKKTLADIAGQRIVLTGRPTAQYLLMRALATARLGEADVTLDDTASADIVDAFGKPDITALVAENARLGEILGSRNAQDVFDSSEIPGEIQHLLVLKTAVLAASPDLAKALTGAWYEVMSIMAKKNAESAEARAQMARASGMKPAAFNSLLAATHIYADPADAARFLRSRQNIAAAEQVRTFCFERGLLGERTTSVDAIGIGFAAGFVLGDRQNMRFRYDPRFTEMAARHEL